MLQNMYNVYLRGFEGKPKPKYIIKGTLLDKKYNEGKSDKKKGSLNRYLKH